MRNLDALNLEASDFIAVAAIVVSVLAAVWNDWRQRKFLNIEERRDEERKREALKANVYARFTREAHTAYLHIINEGPSEARNIAVELNGKPITANDSVFDESDTVGLLGPGATFPYRFMTYDGMPYRYEVRLRWEDASDENRTWASQLDISG